MKTFKTILVCLTILCVLAAGLFLTNKYTDLDLFGKLFGKGMQLEKTANVVTEIRNISEFTSACYYGDLVLAEQKSNDNAVNVVSGWFGKDDFSMDELCLIINGKVRAGFDLTKVAEDAIITSGDTISMTLPQTEIFDIIVNPSNCDVFVEEGKWSHDEVTALQTQARAKIEQDALNYGILEQADKIGRERLTELFKTFGFNIVILN